MTPTAVMQWWQWCGNDTSCDAVFVAIAVAAPPEYCQCCCQEPCVLSNDVGDNIAVKITAVEYAAMAKTPVEIM